VALFRYFLSTFLGLYNKQLLGKDHGLYGKGAFPAPLLMSGVQFAFQCMLAKLVFWAQLVQRSNKAPIDWPTYWKIGKLAPVHAGRLQAAE
jgi:solute carrier family 35 protein C2